MLGHGVYRLLGLTAKGTLGLAGNPVGRIALGGAIGGIYGAAQSNNFWARGDIASPLAYAAGGMALGLGTTALGRSVLWDATKGAAKGLRANLLPYQGKKGLIWSGAKFAAGTAKTIGNYPGLFLGGGAIAGASLYLGNRRPETIAPVNAYGMPEGIAPVSPAIRDFRSSTEGLVNGLHQRRHR